MIFRNSFSFFLLIVVCLLFEPFLSFSVYGYTFEGCLSVCRYCLDYILLHLLLFLRKEIANVKRIRVPG